MAQAPNTCIRCGQRITQPGVTARTFAKAMEIRQEQLYLQCPCGTWNPMPERLKERLRLVLVVGQCVS